MGVTGLRYISMDPGSIKEAHEIQEKLRSRVIIRPLTIEPRYVGGVDAAFLDQLGIGVISVFSFPTLEPLEDVHHIQQVSLSYLPGFLSFREGILVWNAFQRLKIVPDLLLFDGQGIAHPRRMGIATHMGVVLGVPSIGCAKSRLCGIYNEPGIRKGDWTQLYDKNELIGAVLRTRENVRPLFISPGHLTDLESSLRIVLQCTTSFRIPEPIRRADHVSKRMIRALRAEYV